MSTLSSIAALVLLSSTAQGQVAVDVDRLDATVRALSGAEPVVVDGAEITLSSRHIDHPDHEVARAWLLGQLRSIDGLRVWEEPFEHQGRTGLGNLVAELPGTLPSLPTIVIGAHLDSIATFTDDWVPEADPAPGADDDASGCAAVIELARQLAGRRFLHPIRFVLFDAEEVGLVGAAVHAENLAAEGTDVRLMWSLDPIGHNPGGAGVLWTTYDARWPDDALALEAIGTERDALEVLALDAALIGGDRRSDHAPFWDLGYPALHVASFPQPPEYHTVEDTVAVVDPTFLAEVTSVVGEHVVSIAGEVEPPEPTARGCTTAPRLPWGVRWTGVRVR